ncbi:MAG TPA: NAD(P)-dependent methylenetetrahydromethanopterin dehydrogenase [Solirubrobacteraceae bacterium]
MKKILLQLDTDQRASPFDAIVAYDAGVDVVMPYAGVEPEDVRGLVQDAFFTRGIEDLATLAVWIGGSDVALGESMLAEVQQAFFGPFRVSAMLDSNGCNTTAAAAVVRLASDADLQGRRALVIGVGPVGLRAAMLLEREGCDVTVAAIPADMFGEDRPYHRPRGLAVAAQLGLAPIEPADRATLRALMRGATVVLAAGPAGVRLVDAEDRANRALRYLVDFNATEPLGVEGLEARDDLVERDGTTTLGALGIGGHKMKAHKGCVRSLFERNDLVLDLDGVYEVAQGLG